MLKNLQHIKILQHTHIGMH